ncbi:hypothetical protein AG1IA_04222 [Rhizoctonia solani AG-1 IA]|uniref:BRCT domain-containing protein n=1 Tax=Thanatephorus cucumeris (strain AG1-IA) TaxID=983506 RepID=L8WUT5_THACA|nr:hypothetical protein AG1IA_04222 [Rhizoctonia solani AG-1 IA]
MWVISGPFDGVQEGVKEKLLKPGTTYIVGRAKAGQSMLNRINLEQKSISHEHVEIVVGNYEIDDVVSQVLTRRPVISNIRGALARLPSKTCCPVDFKAREGYHSFESASYQGVLWKPVVVVNADNRVKKERMREIAASAAKIGITVSKTWRDDATHFVTPSINMSRRVLHSLMLGIPLVDLNWLEELFRRGNTLTVESEPEENGVVALEYHFLLPNEPDFRPKLVKPDDEDEDITQWPLELWDANPARRTIWDGLQFHFFCDDTVPTEWTDQVQLGGGTFKTHNYNPENLGEAVTTAEEAKLLFQKIRLEAEKLSGVACMKSPVVIVIKPSELTGLLAQVSRLAVKANNDPRNGFKSVAPKDITLAVLRMDAKSIDCGLETFGSSTVLAQPKKSTMPNPSFSSIVPPSHTGDASAPGLPSVITTSASRAPEPSEAPMPEARRPRPLKKLRPKSQERSEMPPPEPVTEEAFLETTEDKHDQASEVSRPRPLKRRVKTTTVAEALGLDNSSASITAIIPLEEELKPQLPRAEAKKPQRLNRPPSSITLHEGSEIAASSTSRPNRLKRRADVLAERTTTAPTPVEIDIPQAPALKRYRQLFEGVERAASSVVEVDEGSTISAAASNQPFQSLVSADDTKKRKSADRDDVDMEDVTRVKRRVLASGISQQYSHLDQNTTTSEPDPGSQVATKPHLLSTGQAHTRSSVSRGAAPGAPDKDGALLRALAQTENEAIAVSRDGKLKGTKNAPIDQDFANMRIAEEKDKEEASRRRAEEMRIWEECERDVNVRGNFMVVEFVDLVRRNRGPPARSINPAWDGKPDFKKFKKKIVGPRVARVDVFPNNDANVDYGMGDGKRQLLAALADVRGSSEGPRSNIRVQDDDSDTPMPNITRGVRGHKVAHATTHSKTSVISEPKAKIKPQRIALSSGESDEDGMRKLKGASSNVGIGKRRLAVGSTHKTNLADFGMRDEDSGSEDEGGSRSRRLQEEQSFGAPTKAGDEDAVSYMVEQESHQVTTTGALSHMSSLGDASLGARKPATSSSSVIKPSKPKKIVVADSDSDGGGFKGFGTKRRKRGVA